MAHVDGMPPVLGDCRRCAHAGTAGLRGRMGPGFNRMNAVTVQQTTQGLLKYLQRQEGQRLGERGVVIGEGRKPRWTHSLPLPGRLPGRTCAALCNTHRLAWGLQVVVLLAGRLAVALLRAAPRLATPTRRRLRRAAPLAGVCQDRRGRVCQPGGASAPLLGAGAHAVCGHRRASAGEASRPDGRRKAGMLIGGAGAQTAAWHRGASGCAPKGLCCHGRPAGLRGWGDGHCLAQPQG